MKPRRLISLIIGVAALTTLAAGARKMTVWRGVIQPTVAAASSNMTAISVDPLLTPQGNLEYDTNRSGSDYRGFELSQADPETCRNECANDSACRAFTYVKPGVQGARARCWLKSAVPVASANNCCVSGIKSGGSSNGGLEVNVNRRGGDYRDYDLPDNNPNTCRNDCMNDSKCKSFTYLRPSYWGPNAHCFLKDSVPAATQEDCCISGVKGGGTGGGTGGGSGINVTGRWTFECCKRNYGGQMGLVQNGSRLSGAFENGGGDIEGTVNGTTLTFQRNLGGGKVQNYVLNLGADGKTLTGSFSGAYSDTPNGADFRATRP